VSVLAAIGIRADGIRQILSVAAGERATEKMKRRTAAALVEHKVAQTLTYCVHPSMQWRQLHTNNPLERIIREIRRRTQLVRTFPGCSRVRKSFLQDGTG
jgi:transposase-like protein